MQIRFDEIGYGVDFSTEESKQIARIIVALQRAQVDYRLIKRKTLYVDPKHKQVLDGILDATFR